MEKNPIFRIEFVCINGIHDFLECIVRIFYLIFVDKKYDEKSCIKDFSTQSYDMDKTYSYVNHSFLALNVGTIETARHYC